LDLDAIWDGEWGVLDEGGDRRWGRVSFFWGVNLGSLIVTNGDFAMRLFPNYFDQDLKLPYVIRHASNKLLLACPIT